MNKATETHKRRKSEQFYQRFKGKFTLMDKDGHEGIISRTSAPIQKDFSRPTSNLYSGPAPPWLNISYTGSPTNYPFGSPEHKLEHYQKSTYASPQYYNLRNSAALNNSADFHAYNRDMRSLKLDDTRLSGNNSFELTQSERNQNLYLKSNPYKFSGLKNSACIHPTMVMRNRSKSNVTTPSNLPKCSNTEFNLPLIAKPERETNQQIPHTNKTKCRLVLRKLQSQEEDELGKRLAPLSNANKMLAMMNNKMPKSIPGTINVSLMQKNKYPWILNDSPKGASYGVRPKL